MIFFVSVVFSFEKERAAWDTRSSRERTLSNAHFLFCDRVSFRNPFDFSLHHHRSLRRCIVIIDSDLSGSIAFWREADCAFAQIRSKFNDFAVNSLWFVGVLDGLGV